MSEQITDTVEDYISDEELDAGYVAPEVGDEEEQDELFLDQLAAQIAIKEENYVEDDDVVDYED